MTRSRSSFDIDGAVATAATLVKKTKSRKVRTPSAAPAGAPLVSFESRPPPSRTEPEPVSASPLSPAFEELAPSSDLSPLSGAGAGAGLGLRSALPPSGDDVDSRRELSRHELSRHELSRHEPSRHEPSRHELSRHELSRHELSRHELSSDDMALDLPSPASSASFSALSGPLSQRLDDAVRELAAGRALPRFPDLAATAGPVARCEKAVEWIAEATGAADVFLADAAGLPFAGAIRDTEARLAASGLIASAVGSLVTALPGAPSQRFELCVGDGPFFQLIGFQASSAAYIVGLMRSTPLTPREVHAVRIACRHALDAAVGVVG
ncbi:hypothetical protein SOCE26_084230 [Sorangium cellulosum]|uniref:Uncharacterized protein n=1 Tax=Sorangium cellulosum TaxID=56 RepID=A0A2L0F5U6_SORCE|nr:hypothetical protein [Sorangium cellulosum]AUX46913.1 hypothetical protein SOCE26_084230 [Sorangium cellulosum]